MTKRKKEIISSVMFTYVGTDREFDAFLKMLLHDYLAAGQPYMLPEQKTVEKVESDVA